MNSVTIQGNIVADPEVRFTQNGKAVSQFRIGVNKKTGDKEKVSFFDVTCFGATAEGVRGLRKGSPVVVFGELEQQRWEAKDTGEKKQKVSIVGWSVARPCYGTQERQEAPRKTTPAAQGDDGNAPLPNNDDDLPY